MQGKSFICCAMASVPKPSLFFLKTFIFQLFLLMHVNMLLAVNISFLVNILSCEGKNKNFLVLKIMLLIAIIY